MAENNRVLKSRFEAMDFLLLDLEKAYLESFGHLRYKNNFQTKINDNYIVMLYWHEGQK